MFKLTRIASLALSFTLLGGGARACDPYTCVQAGAAVFGVLKGIADSADTAKWRTEASGKLDKIISQNKEILKELREFKVFIPLALEQKFEEEDARSAIALTRRFDQYMVGAKPDISAIKAMRGEVEQTSYDLIDRGPAVYQATYASAVLGLAVFQIGGGVRKEQRAKFLAGR